MRNKIDNILNILMGSVVGVFIGYGIYSILDYKTHPGLYAMQSAPWYTGVLVYGVFAVALLALCIVLKLIIRKKSTK